MGQIAAGSRQRATADEAPARIVARNRLLGLLEADVLSLLAPHLADTALEKGRVLHDAGQPIEQVYFPHGGIISLSAGLPENQIINVAMIGRWGAVGLAAGIGSPIAINRAIVQLRGTGGQIAAAELRRLVRQSPALHDAVVRANDMLTAWIQQSAVCNALHDATARLCRSLLDLREGLAANIVPITHDLLAEMLGVRRTSITLICGLLQQEGILQTRRGRIVIQDAAALEQRSCSCYRIMRHWAQRMHAL
jgi:CRP-like cAMP-binding protein